MIHDQQVSCADCSDVAWGWRCSLPYPLSRAQTPKLCGGDEHSPSQLVCGQVSNGCFVSQGQI